MEKRAAGSPTQHSEAQLCVIVGFEDADIPPLTLRGTPVALLLVDNRPLLQHTLYFWRLFGYDDFVILCHPDLRARLQEAVESWIARQDEPSGMEGARILVFSEKKRLSGEGGSRAAGGEGREPYPDGPEEDSAGHGGQASLEGPGAEEGFEGGPHGSSRPERRSGSAEEGQQGSWGYGRPSDGEAGSEGSSAGRSGASEGRSERSESAGTKGSEGSEPGEDLSADDQEITAISTLRAAIRAGCFNCDNVILLRGSMYATIIPALILRYHREANRACTVLLSNFLSPFRCNVAPDFKKCTKGCLVVQEYGSGSQTGILTSWDIRTLSRHQNFPLECVMVRRGLEKRQLAEDLWRQQQAWEQSRKTGAPPKISVDRDELALAADVVNEALELGFQKLYYQPGVGAIESKRSLLNYLPLNLSPDEIMHSLGFSGPVEKSGSTSLLSAISAVNMFALPSYAPVQGLEVMHMSAKLQDAQAARQGHGRAAEPLATSMVPPAYPLCCGKLTFYSNLTLSMVEDQEQGFLRLPLEASQRDSTVRVYEQRAGLAIFSLPVLGALVQVEGLTTVFDEAIRFLIEQEQLPAAERHPLFQGSELKEPGGFAGLESPVDVLDSANSDCRSSPRGVGQAIVQAPFSAGAGFPRSGSPAAPEFEASAGAGLRAAPGRDLRTPGLVASYSSCSSAQSALSSLPAHSAAPTPSAAPVTPGLPPPAGDPDTYDRLARAVQIRYSARAEETRIMNDLVHRLDDHPYPDPFAGGEPAQAEGSEHRPASSPLSESDLRRATSGVAFVETRGSPLLRLPVISCVVADGKSYAALNYTLHRGATCKLPVMSPVLRNVHKDAYSHVLQTESLIGRYCNFMPDCELVRSTVDAYCMFGNHVRLENCILGRNVTVSNNVVLRDCILKDHVVIHSGSKLSGCVIEAGTKVGRRCVLRDCMAGPKSEIKEETAGKGMMFAG